WRSARTLSGRAITSGAAAPRSAMNGRKTSARDQLHAPAAHAGASSCGVYWEGTPADLRATYAAQMDNRAEVREFLMSRRAKVTPAEAGLVPGPNRRVRGLRRTEVALL